MSELLDFVHRLVFKFNATFRSVHLFPSSGQRLGKPLGPVSENSCCVGSNWQAYVKPFYHLAAGSRNSLLNTVTGQLKCDGTRAETRFRLSAKRTSPFKSAGGRQFSRLLAAEVCATAVVMLETPCSEVVWRVLATHSICQFPLHFSSRASPCSVTFQL